MKRLPVAPAVTLMLIGWAVNAAAEPYVIRPISSLTLDFEGDIFRFVGDGFAVNQDAQSLVGVFISRTSDPSCDPCRVGDTFDPGFRTTGEVPLGTGEATFGSTMYSNLTLSGTLNFDATPVVFPGSEGDGFQLQTPFAFNGFLRGVSGGDQKFAAAFTGSGHAVRFFDKFDDGRYGAGENHQVFIFDAPGDPAPVPEPATMLLVGTGAGIAGLIKRRKLRGAVQHRLVGGPARVGLHVPFVKP